MCNFVFRSPEPTFSGRGKTTEVSQREFMNEKFKNNIVKENSVLKIFTRFIFICIVVKQL